MDEPKIMMMIVMLKMINWMKGKMRRNKTRKTRKSGSGGGEGEPEEREGGGGRRGEGRKRKKSSGQLRLGNEQGNECSLPSGEQGDGGLEMTRERKMAKTRREG